MSSHLFIAGVPCTGKSLLGNWLEAEREYFHVDAERDGGTDFDRAGFHREWDELIATGLPNAFLTAADRVKKPIVLNWGFPLFPCSYVFVVPALQSGNFSAWWFNGDRGQARTGFIKRESKKPVSRRISVDLFDHQMNQIERHRFLLEKLFGDNVINGLRQDGSQRSAEDIWKEITERDKTLRQ
jgi:hypothetical protein